MTDSKARLGLGEESIPLEEPRAIAQALAINLAMVDPAAKPVKRGEHPKSNGLLAAYFSVEADLPEAYRGGVFRAPTTYHALVRFSNGSQQNDNNGDIRGVAIKLVGVAGDKILESSRNAETQDFLLADGPVFFIRNAAEYVPFSQSVQAAKRSFFGKLVLLFKVLFFPRAPWKLLRAALSSKPNSPLTIVYWSQTPYLLNGRGAHYVLQPSSPQTEPAAPASSSPNKLREAIEARLKSGSVELDFLVQLQVDAQTMPIEDPTVAWDESAHPPVKMATLRIPPQDFNSPERLAFDENLSFTPWHSLPEHRPLGGINRARRAIYEAMSKRRHELNQVAAAEPSVQDIQGFSGFER